MNRTTSPIAACTIFSFVATFCLSMYGVERVMAQSQNEISKLQAKVREKDESPKDVDGAMSGKFSKTSFPYYEPPDGCSTPFPGGIAWGWGNNELFKRACDNHDICYTTPGNPKPYCDEKFLSDMLRICETGSYLCNSWARDYYTGVVAGAQSAYDTAQRQETEYIRDVYSWLNTSTKPDVSLAGTWQSDWGPVVFNSNLTGYWNQGGGTGQIQSGTYDPKLRRLVFRYYQPWNDMNGTATLALSQDGDQLSGTWTQQKGANSPGSGGSGTWTMRRNRSQ